MKHTDMPVFIRFIKYSCVLLLLSAFECCIIENITVETSNFTADNWKACCNTMEGNNRTTMNDCANRNLQIFNQGLMRMKDQSKYQKNIEPSNMLPENFDVRDKFGKRCPGINRVYNQGQCKSGWAVAIASVISDRICIKSHGKKQIMLSAQNLLSCCRECCGCNGGIILNAWHWVINNGIVSGSIYQDKKSCMPYKIPPAHPKMYKSPGFGGEWSTANLALQHCTKTCRDGSFRTTTKIKGYQLWSQTNHLQIMKQLMTYGPLQVSMHIYNDFRYYKEGIYIHTTGIFEGEHAVKLIGWGTWKDTKYWLAMNSFGNNSWGMNGTFMVPRNGNDNTKFGYAIISPILTDYRSSGINFLKTNMLTVFLNILFLMK